MLITEFERGGHVGSWLVERIGSSHLLIKTMVNKSRLDDRSADIEVATIALFLQTGFQFQR
jgi:hypothetical protein